MKYFIGSIVGLLISLGIIAGVIVVKNNNSTSTTVATGTDGIVTSSKTTLDLSNKGIAKVNSDIYGKTSTTSLDLSNNSIKTLPSEMGKMTNLVSLKLDHNLLEGSLIGEVRQMSRLKILDVSYNNITGMPAEIGQLSNLETLDYSYNNISGLPNELANLKNTLKVFNLTGNPLSETKISNLKASLPYTSILF